jgi:IclR family acetate operon transcriptional repressor
MQSVKTALAVLESVAEGQPVGVSELARALGLPKSSVQRSLTTLADAGWIRREAAAGPTRWVLTTRALDLSRHTANEFSLRDAALPVMEELRDSTNETIHLMVPTGDVVVLVEQLTGRQPIRIVLSLGQEQPLHVCSNGKAILAASSDDELATYLANDLSRFTDATIADPDQLEVEIARTRQRGYATNRGEWRTDIVAVASAILNESGQPVASMSIATPPDRMPEALMDDYGQMIRKATTRITSRMRGDGG